MKSLCLSAALVVAATAVQAQSVIFGAGYADYSEDTADDLAIFSVEYQHAPFYEATRLSATWGAALTVDTDGDTHVGVGLVGAYSFADRWFAELSVMPGYYNAANDLNDLGGNFQIRSLLGVGYSLDNGNKISLAVTHKSNASTDDPNPGVNAFFLRYHLGF
ncbi:MAG: acyloxyacyl hydrolase [Pseudomonadota bacterium]